MRRYIKSDYDATLPADMLYAPNGDENMLRNYYRGKADEERKSKEEAAKRAEKEAEMAEFKEKYPEDAILAARESEDTLDELFNLAVPSSGSCETVGGEIVRAVMRILYRDYNDGDVFYEGYGRETCLSCVTYLCDIMEELLDDFDRIANQELKDDEYTNAITSISNYICDKLTTEDIELFWTSNEEDCLKSDPDKYEFHEPTYMYDGDFTDAVIEAMFDDRVSQYDVETAVAQALSWEGIDYEYLSVGEYGWSVEGLSLDDYEKLQDYGVSISESIEDDLEIEPPEDEDEEEW